MLPATPYPVHRAPCPVPRALCPDRRRYPGGNFEDCSGKPPEGMKCWNNGVRHWHKNLDCVGKARTVCNDQYLLF